MPRSLARPNVSTYHEAVYAILEVLPEFDRLPLTKKEDKFTVKSVAYLAGRCGLPIGAKIQDVFYQIIADYGLPAEFLTWIRVMQQHLKGVVVPASYGTMADNRNLMAAALGRLNLGDTEEIDYQDGDFVTDEEVYDYSDPSYANSPTERELLQAKYDALAAANPMAAAFAQSIMRMPDEEDEDEDEWGYDGTIEDWGYGDDSGGEE
jgi:hypothetical protein